MLTIASTDLCLLGCPRNAGRSVCGDRLGGSCLGRCAATVVELGVTRPPVPYILAGQRPLTVYSGAAIVSPMTNASTYQAQSARDAQAAGCEARYCEYLDHHAHELHAYFTARGDHESADLMLTRSWSESLRGNDGD